MHKHDIWFYIAVFMFIVFLSLIIIGEKQEKPNDVNITNSIIKVEVKK